MTDDQLQKSDENLKRYVFKFECSEVWENLTETEDENIRHCRRCDKNVHLVQTHEEFTDNAAKGNCTYSPEIRTAGIPVRPEEIIKPQITAKAERPDKPVFFGMMGVFFVFFSLPAFYWANYNYGEYRRNSEFVQELREKPTDYLTPNEKKEHERLISFNSSRTDRFKLEMFLSGAGGLVLFGIALIFFKKALSARKRKNFYEKANPRTFPLPNAPIEVEYKNIYGVLFWLILIFFGGIFLLITYQSFTNPFITNENAIIRTFLFGIPLLFFVAVFVFLMLRAKRNVVRLIDNSGVMRGDGKHFAWQEFCGVIRQTAFNQRTQRRYLWRIELAFENGETVWIIPNRIRNYDEIFGYVEILPLARLKAQ